MTISFTIRLPCQTGVNSTTADAGAHCHRREIAIYTTRDKGLKTEGVLSQIAKWDHESAWLLPPRQERSRLTLERILDAAEALFTRKGYENTTLADIATRAGLSIGSIYRRFPDKDSILQTIHESYCKLRTDDFAQVFDPAEWADAHIAHIVPAMMDYLYDTYRKSPGILCMIEKQRLVNPVVNERATAWNDYVISMIHKVLSQHAGEIAHADVERAVSFMHYVVHRVLAMTVLLEQAEASPAYRVEDDAFKAEMTRMILGYLGVPPRMEAVRT
jgi:AcrR family transcriptional regulator